MPLGVSLEMRAIDLRPLIEGHKGEWVAFDDDYTKVLAHSKSLEETAKKAEADGFNDPIFFRVPDEFIAWV